jgi:hypothetical protein
LSKIVPNVTLGILQDEHLEASDVAAFAAEPVGAVLQ